ncbi:hypothetical protein BP6252_04920 [Coleophoma cylindrospora]|uniref:Allergen n=1 Tax=Coleophoma cylindrospora TaxID=1849047 RepID=A0A3D8S1U4_9HELO|nr:hypothetical protein BP6252_04920 [Coleophoma cylindrospora]
MENAVTAVNKLFGRDSAPNRNVDTTVDAEVAPAVEHTHVKKQHETRTQTFVEKEKHQDHYHTTIQPLKDTEVLPEKHDHIQETKHSSINHDDGGAKAKAESDRAGFKSTSEQKQYESKTQEPTQKEEHIHHHLHETIQPVIEKQVIDPSVTHKRVDVKEKIQEPAENHGVTINSAIPVEEFKRTLSGVKN